MTTYAKRKLKYSRNENFNLLHYVEWNGIVTLTGAQADWGLRYRIYSCSRTCIVIIDTEFYGCIYEWPQKKLLTLSTLGNVDNVCLCVCLFVWWCLTPLSTIFQLLYRGGQFYWWANRRTRRKPLTCRKSLTNFIT